MRSSFNVRLPKPLADLDWREDRLLWLRIAAGVLILANAIALVLYLAAPGGSQNELKSESERLATTVAGARLQEAKVKHVAGRVQLGAQQSVQFDGQYILPKRLAYASVLAEIQRMAQAAKLQMKDSVNSEEPIEGTDDLSLLNSTANFEGTYPDLMKFLYEVDHSALLLMLDRLQASPGQNGTIGINARFQAVIRDEATEGRRP